MGVGVLTTPATTVKPRSWLFQYWNSLASCLTLPGAIAMGSGHEEQQSALLSTLSPIAPTILVWFYVI